MKKYIGTKTVSAIPAWRVGGKIYPKDGPVPRSMNREDGYEVVYEDGYKSWSPKEAFEKAYKVADTFLDRLNVEDTDLAEKYEKCHAFVESDKFRDTIQLSSCISSERLWEAILELCTIVLSMQMV